MRDTAGRFTRGAAPGPAVRRAHARGLPPLDLRCARERGEPAVPGWTHARGESVERVFVSEEVDDDS